MMNNQTAAGRFAQLDSLRNGYLKRAERHAAFTLRRICLPKDWDTDSDVIQNDWQSVGAQGANHLANKLMLTMFAPSRPFIRYGFTEDSLAKFQNKLGLDGQQIEEMCAAKEREAVKAMDAQTGLRPALFDVALRLIIIGDALMHLPREKEGGPPASYDLRDYVLKRTPSGRIAELLVRERVILADLKPEARALYRPGDSCDDTEQVNVYRWIKRTGEHDLSETQWVETYKLGEDYSREYTDETSEWHSFAWHLPRNADYGVGHVEEYAGSFASLSALAKAEVEGALLASEFRWLVNPGGVTKVNDLLTSRNGAAIPGLPQDVHLMNNSKPGDLQVVANAIQSHIRVLGRAFLMPSAITRDAERVTTEELRQQAMELETGLGGAYTRLSGTLQLNIGKWLTHKIGLDVGEQGLQLNIITGLDALSRNGDLAALRAALADISGLQNLGNAAGVLKLSVIVSDIFMGHGLSPTKYVKSAAEQKSDQQAAEAQHARTVNTEAAAQAASKPQ